MDGVSIAANIVALATAGVTIAIKLVTLATQISTASERVTSIGNDISLTAGVLHQLGELMTQKTIDDGISIFNQGGLETTRTSAAMCQRIFEEVENELKKATEQIRGCKRLTGGKIKLSRTEKAKWPFLQPSIDVLRADLRETKGTLMLMLQVTSLALSKRMADLNQSASSNMIEQRDFMRAIVALHQQQHTGEKKSAVTSSAPREGSGSPSSITTAAIRSIDLSSSGEDTATISVYLQASIPPNQPRTPTKITKLIANTRGLPMQLSDASRHSTEWMSGDLGEDVTPALSSPELPLPNNFDISNSSSTIWSDCWPNYIASSLDTGESTDNIIPNGETKKELVLFLLKPMVREFFDRIEISWSVQKTRMQEPAIRKQMDKNEADGVPSVIDMLEELNAYEQAMVDTELSETSSRPEALLLSLKRTKIDIRHRDIVLKAVPGLQFVVERQVALAAPQEVDEALISKMKGFKQRLQERPRSSPDTGHAIPGSYTANAVGMRRKPTVVTMSRKGVASRLGSNGGAESQIRNNSITNVTKSEFEAEPEPPFAGLEGLVVIDNGMIADTDGNKVGVVVKGDTKALIGCTTNEYGDVMNKYGKVKGYAEPYEEYEGEAIGRAVCHTDDEPEPPFAGLEGLVIIDNGMIADTDGNRVGVVVKGDTKALIGCTANEYGDIMNKYGEVKGHAQPYEEPEEDAVDLSFVDGKIVAKGGDFFNEVGTLLGCMEGGDTAKLVGRTNSQTDDIWSDDGTTIGLSDIPPGTGRAEETAPDNAETSYESLMIMTPTNERPNIPFRLDRRESLEEERISGLNTAPEIEGRYVAEKGSLLPLRYHHQQRLIYYRQSHVTSSGTGARDENSLEPIASLLPPISPRCSCKSSSGKGTGGSEMSKHASVNTEELPTDSKPPVQPRVSSIESNVYRIMTFDTEDGTVPVPDDRKCTSGTSSRFRQRRHEREREASQRTSDLEKQVQEMKLLLLESEISTNVYHGLTAEDESAESTDGDEPEEEQGDEDAVVVELLERYTTLYEEKTHH